MARWFVFPREKGKSSIQKVSAYNVLTVSSLTLISRVLGFAREMLCIRSLGTKAVSDAFLTAFRIPSLLHELFIGGSLGSAVAPLLGHVVRTEGMHAASKLMTGLIAIGISIAGMVCAIVMLYAPLVIRLVVPGFSGEQLVLAISLVRILILFMLCSAITALLVEALRIKHTFTIPASSQIILNTIFIGGLFWYARFHPPIMYLAWIIVCSSIVPMIVHIMGYFSVGFTIALPDTYTWSVIRTIGKRIIPCMTATGMSEISTFIELQFASFLPIGSVSILSYTASFMRLPLGILVHALATVLFPDFVRLASYSQPRLCFLIFESIKAMVWVLVPIAVGMGWYAADLFAALYHLSAETVTVIETSRSILLIKLCGLCFLAINRILFNACYALHNTKRPSMIALASTGCGILCNALFLQILGIYGIALTGVITALLRTVLLLLFLDNVIGISRYAGRFVTFLYCAMQQWICIGVPFFLSTWIVRSALCYSRIPYLMYCVEYPGLWVWTGILALVAVYSAWCTRRFFGISLYVLER